MRCYFLASVINDLLNFGLLSLLLSPNAAVEVLCDICYVNAIILG